MYKYNPADTAATGVWYKKFAIGMRFLTVKMVDNDLMVNNDQNG